MTLPAPSPAENPVLIALDFDTADAAVAFARLAAPYVGGFKVGLELVNAAGFDVFARLQDAGAGRLFYDAKFHDIPNTVAGAVRAAARRGVWMVNVHTSGGRAMMEAAREAADTVSAPPLLIGVTVLTSLDDAALAEMGIADGVEAQVERVARLAQGAGLDGVVASPHEVGLIRRACGDAFVTVIPGVRPAGAEAQDQKRVATPGDAIRAGAHYLVVGRAVTAAPDPAAAAEAVAREAMAAREADHAQ